MLGDQAWSTVSIPIHLKGGQWGWGQGAVQATWVFNINISKPCHHKSYFFLYRALIMQEHVQVFKFQWREMLILQH